MFSEITMYGDLFFNLNFETWNRQSAYFSNFKNITHHIHEVEREWWWKEIWYSWSPFNSYIFNTGFLYNQKTHSSSGLLEEIRKSTVSVTVAEKETLNFVSKYVKKGESPLCGNSIHTDRTYLSKEMPDLQEYLHYRIIDVSSLKGIVQRWYPKKYWFIEFG